MKKFTVTVTETAEYEMTVEAETAEEAEEIGKQRLLDHVSLDDGCGISCDITERSANAEEIAE